MGFLVEWGVGGEMGGFLRCLHMLCFYFIQKKSTNVCPSIHNMQKQKARCIPVQVSRKTGLQPNPQSFAYFRKKEILITAFVSKQSLQQILFLCLK